MNVNNSSFAQINYAQLQNNSSVQAQSAQSGFSPEAVGTREANEGNDHDGDDAGKNSSAQNAQALSQLLNKQQNSIFPTSPKAQDLQSLLMKNITALYASSSQSYANNAQSALASGINIKA